MCRAFNILKYRFGKGTYSKVDESKEFLTPGYSNWNICSLLNYPDCCLLYPWTLQAGRTVQLFYVLV